MKNTFGKKKVNIQDMNSLYIKLFLWKSYKDLKIMFRMLKKTNEGSTSFRNYQEMKEGDRNEMRISRYKRID